MIIPNSDVLNSAKESIKPFNGYSVGMSFADNNNFRYHYLEDVIKGYSYAMFKQNRPDETVKMLVEKLNDKVYNYNDFDCDIFGRSVSVDAKCWCTDTIISRLMGDCECKCINGIVKNNYTHYFLMHCNHGNSVLYHTVKNNEYDGVVLFNIRRLEYNLSDSQLNAILDNCCTNLFEDRVLNDFLRYDDSRDSGFSFSVNFFGDSDVVNIDASHFSCYDIQYVTEHLSPLFYEI